MQGISFSSNSPRIGPEPLSPVKATPDLSTSGSSTSSSPEAPESGAKSSLHLTSAVDPDPVIKFTAIEAKEQGGSSAPPQGGNPPGRIDIGGGTAGRPLAGLVSRSSAMALQQGAESSETMDSLTESALSTRLDVLA